MKECFRAGAEVRNYINPLINYCDTEVNLEFGIHISPD